MVMTDPIADMLTRIRNANAALHEIHRFRVKLSDRNTARRDNRLRHRPRCGYC